MKALHIVLIVLVAAVAAERSNWEPERPYYDLNDAEQLFLKFIKDYDRHYKDEEDYQIHFEAFKDSLRGINESNAISVAIGSSGLFDITPFSDYTKEEFNVMNGFRPLDELSEEDWATRDVDTYNERK